MISIIFYVICKLLTDRDTICKKLKSVIKYHVADVVTYQLKNDKSLMQNFVSGICLFNLPMIYLIIYAIKALCMKVQAKTQNNGIPKLFYLRGKT